MKFRCLFLLLIIVINSCTSNYKSEIERMNQQKDSLMAKRDDNEEIENKLGNIMNNSIEYKIDNSVPTSLPTCDDFNSVNREKLRSNVSLHWTSVGKNDANKIKLFGMAKGDFQKNTKKFVLDFTTSLDTSCNENGIKLKYRLSAGLRVVFTVKDWSLKVGIDNLEKVAASKELNFSESELNVEMVGWGSDDSTIKSDIKILENINVRNYPEASKALINLLDAYSKQKTVKPQILPIL